MTDTPAEPSTPDKPLEPTVTNTPASIPYIVPGRETDKADYDFAEIRALMQESDWLVYSPQDWVYDAGADGGFHVFVGTSSDRLLNVYMDGKRISIFHKDFKLNEENGIILMVFSEEFLQRLSPGKHVLRIQIAGYDEVSRTVVVLDT